MAGLITKHGTYTGDFKVSVVEYMHNTGASIRKTAALLIFLLLLCKTDAKTG